MASSFEFDVEPRTNTGKGDSRRTRKLGKIPAIIYGGKAEPTQICLDHNTITKALENEATYSHILKLKLDGREESVILKAMQRHPARPIIMHMDFQRVSETDKIKVHVPLHFINQDTSVGVKKGGMVAHSMVEVEVYCLPQHLPEYIEVDVAALDVGESIHLSGIKLPIGVEIPALHHGPDHDFAVAAIHATKGGSAEA
jgi:large subunit ribosomal protein L25